MSNIVVSTTVDTLMNSASQGEARDALGSVPKVVTTIAQLKGLSGDDLTGSVWVHGYTTAGDGGGGLFRWVAADATADNGGTVFAPTDGGGRFFRVYDGTINVRHFGAKGDGVADDTAAIRLAAAVLVAAGGGRLLFPKGNYYTYTDGSAAALVVLASLTGVSIEGDNATITVNRAFTGVQMLTLFDLTACDDVRFSGIRVVGPTEAVGQRDARGAEFIILKQGCKNVSVVDCSAQGLRSFFTATRLAGDVATYRSRGIRVDGVRIKDCGYGLALQFSGDDTVADIVTEGMHRSAIFFGLSNVRLRVESKDNFADDVFVRGYSGIETSNVDVEYTNINSTSAAAAAPGVSMGPGDQTPTAFRNIAIKVFMRWAVSGAPGHGVHIYKNNNAGGYDTVDRGHTFENITISGHMVGPGTGVLSAVPISAFASGTWGAGEFVRNFQVRDLYIATLSSAFITLASLVDRATFTNVVSDTHFYVTGSGAGRTLFVGCKALNLTGATSDTGVATYVECEITGATLQSFVNKHFIRTKVVSAIRNLVPEAVGYGGQVLRAVKFKTGDLTTAWDAFKIKHAGNGAMYRLKVWAVSNQAEFDPSVRREVIAVLTFSAVQNGSGVWTAQLAAAAEVTQRNQLAVGNPSITLVNGDATGAKVQITVSGYTLANARCVAELEVFMIAGIENTHLEVL